MIAKEIWWTPMNKHTLNHHSKTRAMRKRDTRETLSFMWALINAFDSSSSNIIPINMKSNMFHHLSDVMHKCFRNASVRITSSMVKIAQNRDSLILCHWGAVTWSSAGSEALLAASTAVSCVMTPIDTELASTATITNTSYCELFTSRFRNGRAFTEVLSLSLRLSLLWEEEDCPDAFSESTPFLWM